MPALLTKAPNKARETRAADPIAKPWGMKQQNVTRI
jgi:hypothetical protein